jgi:hypothetical protein
MNVRALYQHSRKEWCKYRRAAGAPDKTFPSPFEQQPLSGLVTPLTAATAVARVDCASSILT